MCIAKRTKEKTELNEKEKEIEKTIKDYLWWKRFVVQAEEEKTELNEKEKEIEKTIKDYLWWKRFVVQDRRGD
ncbi:MAG: hypothetical protein A4E57_04338 [Syntrophorhabdaceae bacterium PtaU1.Bin034]|nr:MAG: hypothetical protein A4E57_04338 [Syntrophorhabdaceae bacterium PtaU1.Bin034]